MLSEGINSNQDYNYTTHTKPVLSVKPILTLGNGKEITGNLQSPQKHNGNNYFSSYKQSRTCDS